MSDSLSETRREYLLGVLTEENLPSTLSPYDLLEAWLSDASSRGAVDSTAMDLSTVDLDGYPSSRIVLLKDISAGGLTFFTNYRSAKGQQLDETTKASANFFWSGLERQVRLQGNVARVSAEISDAYFATRPRESQISAWASPQSMVVKDRAELEALFAKKKLEFDKIKEIPRPPFWGGYCLAPRKFEFWQGRTSRLHDRLTCSSTPSGWTWQRLAP